MGLCDTPIVRKLLASRSGSKLRLVVVGVLAPACAVGIVLALGSRNLAAATALCLLAVVVAAAIGGRGSGLLAAFLSFLGLNYYFTEPHHTLAVHDAGDILALLAFLLSATIVGGLVSAVQAERERAERRATEAQLLNRTTERFISREPLALVLQGLADALLTVFALTRCEFVTEHGVATAVAPEPDSAAGQTVTLPLETASGSFGSLTVERAANRDPLSSAELALVRAVASQTALAIERAVLDDEVRAARVEAESSELRAAILSSVTHDLRTPLASIKASASGLLAEGARYTDEERRDVLRTVVEEADHLNLIVANLLDLARSRAGALVPATQAILLEEVIGAVLQRMTQTLERVSIRTTIRPDLPAVEADPVQIGQVLTNIIENAVRYSPHGSTIEISAARWRSSVQVRVTDQGPGIPADDRERVFEEFYRRDAGGARGGTGLGLAISRAIVNAHGGTISIGRAPTGGTAVTFELPIADRESAQAPAGRGGASA